jgi:4-alpha-glucanotransferase
MAAEQNTRINPFTRRRSGVLLHITSLPGPENHGIIGHDAFRFIEFLAQSGFSIWQTLPLGPTHDDGSPYQCLSAHACDTGLISLEWLYDRKLLDKSPTVHSNEEKELFLKQAFDAFKAQNNNKDFHEFQKQHTYWLDDFSLFMAIREVHDNDAWWEWDKDLRDRDTRALGAFTKKYDELINFYQFKQYIVFNQWNELKNYANENGILLFGDMPIYVALDSADVWANRNLFELDDDGKPTFVSGVPPDYFSDTGQHWGNPLYNWKAMENNDFCWWIERMQSQYELFDLIRIDHFRGLHAYWQIPAEEETAINGEWVKAPGKKLLMALQTSHQNLPLVAEDLGTITQEVHQMRKDFKLPGMKILQFAFDGNPDNLYLPHNHETDMIVYTGTHDNNTTSAWFDELAPESREYICRYLSSDKCEMPWTLNRTALASVAKIAILPMQDILGLGKESRMNTPGTTASNWKWRFQWSQLPGYLTGDIRQLNQLYGRLH